MTMGVDGGADCRACAAALLGADIMSKDDDNMDSMRTSFVRWSTNPNNQEMADQTASSTITIYDNAMVPLRASSATCKSGGGGGGGDSARLKQNEPVAIAHV